MALYYDGLPYGNALLNLSEGCYTPSTIKPHNNAAFVFWYTALMERLESKINFELPEEWGGAISDFFKTVMLYRGYCGVFYDEEYGLSFQPGGLSGYSFYYQPTRFIVSNPKLQREFDIGETCEILKLTSGYHGIADICVYFAEKLAMMDSGLNSGITNNKLAWILGAKNRAAATALKKIFDKVNRGDPVVIFDQRIADDPQSKDTPFQFLERRTSAKENYITDMQLRDIQTIINQFDAEIGIPTVPYQKAERMVTSEADSKTADSKARCEHWRDTFNDSAKLVNDMFGTNIRMTLNITEGGSENGTDTGDADTVRTPGVS